MKPTPSLKMRLMIAFSKLTPDCPAIARLASAGLDRRLTLIERVRIRMHFLICHWCRRYTRQLRFMRSAARRMAEESANPSAHALPPDTRTRFKERLRQATRSGSPHD